MDIAILESDICYMELNHMADTLHDYCIIQSFYEDTEDKTAKTDNLIVKIQKKLKDLVDKIKDAIKKYLLKQKSEEPSRKEYEAYLNKVKVKALNTKKLYGLTKSYKQKIMNAKSEDEIHEIVQEYKKAEDTCFCIVTGVAAIAISKASGAIMDSLDRDSSNALTIIRRTHDRETKKELNKRIDRNEKMVVVNGAIHLGTSVYAFTTLVPMMASAISQIFSSAMKRVEKSTVETDQEIKKEISKAGPSLGYRGKTPKTEVYRAETYKPETYKTEEYKVKKYETEKYKPETYKTEEYKVKKYETEKYKPETYKAQTYKPEVYQPKR